VARAPRFFAAVFPPVGQVLSGPRAGSGFPRQVRSPVGQRYKRVDLVSTAASRRRQEGRSLVDDRGSHLDYAPRHFLGLRLAPEVQVLHGKAGGTPQGKEPAQRLVHLPCAFGPVPPPTLVEFLVSEVVPREASRLGPVAPPQCLLANGTQLAAPLSLLPLDSRGTNKERSKALAVALLEACFIARCRLYESSRQHLQPPTAKARGPAQQISGACVWRLKKLPGERVAVACRIRPG
jgi:hypothetical protein